jgi:hypothetical protein
MSCGIRQKREKENGKRELDDVTPDYTRKMRVDELESKNHVPS